ncbi:Starch-binding associating with outer membrane [Flavobacterium fluvii]|uniref:Starch-binding associating with outer membrane n=1 Tax=Flavobacterium fluvii TaxID=468056 RepID=A0A1M5E5Z8_9FLAO|nr:RagB/SusD family nutrient uptake outer membrane protein [Flavobacterium fluvii]SHF74580.1 Starch-binding associating with outer membrane [Flavobacterium fluvii]
MKNIKNKILVCIASAMMLGSCSDEFLKEKEDLTGVNEQVYQDPILAKAYVDYIYRLILPANNASVFTWDLACNSNSAFAQTTDELGGETNWNKVWAAPGSNTDANCLPYIGAPVTSSIANNTYTRLRQINLFLDNIDNYGMADADKNPLKGEMYFWRAWQYFDLLRLYGGVPLVLNAQTSIGSSEGANQVPRSSSAECLEQIVADLDKAKTLLPGKWPAADWSRITSGAAAAMKGRVLLTWASPLFNRTDDVTRWQRAYDANTEAKTILEANGSALFATGGFANATAWGNMWFAEPTPSSANPQAVNPEAVIVYGFNNTTSSNVLRNNGWEKAARSKTLGGSGAVGATKQIMDAFPMKDGLAPGVSTKYPYTLQTFYKNRDPRFYKTFVYSGAAWAYSEDTNFKQFTYYWHKTAPANAGVLPTGFTETLGTVSTNVYVRKAVNPSASNNTAFQYSGTDYMEMRFAEVLLNLAESAIGINKLTEGRDLIAKVRERAGIESANNFGLSTAVTRDQLFGAAINERKVEFAFENKRFWDLRRWLLYNNDFGTCTRLAQTPIEGMRRQGLFFTAQKVGGGNYVGANDPFIPVNGVAPVADRNPAVYPPGITTYDQYVDYFYTNFIKVEVKDNNEPTSTWKFKWYNQYYFFGIPANALNTSSYLGQTSGWSGGKSIFDPLK